MAKIRNHKERVSVAKKSDELRTDGLKLSRFDLEAYVETFLMEDIRDYHKDRMNALANGNDRTITQERLKNIAIARHANVTKIFGLISDVCWYLIHFGRYSDVWSIIPEHQLYRLATAASNKKLDEMMQIAAKILKRIYNEATELDVSMKRHDEFVADLELEDKNARQYYDLPSRDDISAMVAEVNLLFPDEKTKKTTTRTNKPNLN